MLEGRDTLRLVFDEPVWVDVEAIAELARSGDPAAAREAAALAAPGLLPDADAPWLGPGAPTSRSCGSRRWRPSRATAARCPRPNAPLAPRSPRRPSASPRAPR